MLKGPKGSMIVSIIKFSQDSENVSLAKIIPSGDIKKNASECMYPQNVGFLITDGH